MNPRLVSSGDAEHVPPVAMQKVKLVGQHPLCLKLLDQAPKQPQEQLPKLAESSGVTGPTSGTDSKLVDVNLVYSMLCALWQLH